MYSIQVVVMALLLCLSPPPIGATATDPSGHLWKQITAEANGLGLPTKFLRTVPADFVSFEFDDLQAFAAEYHPLEHRMVLNRTLSFNVAGGTLRPLARLTHVELDTLYHELFHAYMDYLTTTEGQGHVDPFLRFAREQQQCRYSTVLITPVIQRKNETEERFLSERESWEALNEAWAVFVGWTVWSQLEIGQGAVGPLDKPGNYEPEDPTERGVTRKRFLAPASRLASEEIGQLLSGILEIPSDFVKQVTKRLEPNQKTLLHAKACGTN
jgi:hypothetical protein